MTFKASYQLDHVLVCTAPGLFVSRPLLTVSVVNPQIEEILLNSHGPLSNPIIQDNSCLFLGLLPYSLVQGLCPLPLHAQCHFAWGLEQRMCSED